MDPKQEVLFKRDRLYSRTQIRERIGLSARGLDVWLARAEVARYALSKRCIRYLGADLEDALAQARMGGLKRARPTGAAGATLARLGR